MPVIRRSPIRALLARMRSRLAAEEGFTILIALGVLVVTSLLVAASYAAVQADTPLAQRDLEAKRAYYAARSAVNKFLYELNQNPAYWQTCPQQPTKTPIAPGSQQQYTFKPVPANGASACGTGAPPNDPISTLIDNDSATFRYQFTGYSGNPEVSRGLIASFRKDTPLDYLWYTVYETLDPNTYNDPATYADCAAYYRTPRPAHCVNIVWITDDDVNGPMYTSDQYMISGSPDFGRSSTDQIESSNPNAPTNLNSICTDNDCGSADIFGTKVPNAPVISPPPDNDELKQDAIKFGSCNGACAPAVYTGVTQITLSGNTATITNCPSTCTTYNNVPIGKYPSRKPIIYVDNGASCDAASAKYSPYNVTYPTVGPCGNVYVHTSSNYTASLTIAADNDIIINGDLRTDTNSTPVLGLVANNFVRIMHGVTARSGTPSDKGQCGTAANIASQTLQTPVIDTAILALRHSFIVDNYDCGAPMSGKLNITGAISQNFRGTVGTFNGGGINSGYLKQYTYDDRYTVTQPPYMFDVFNSSWHIARETLCVPGGTAPSTTCG
jgi:Tfp pilus assembly protein PilX